MTMTKSDIRLKRAYDPPDDADGTRVLVDRLWPRGLSKDKAALALWLKDIAPSSELRTWFGHNPARFDVFAARYQAELAGNPAVTQLAELIRNGPVTLIYAARDTTHNHALVLADYMRDYLKAAATSSSVG
jgi:uncharacterized protein YeaO (DUF488 family)